ncbi:MAG: DNA-processing protein DprA [Planctomycetaceae bacterium]
MTESELLDALRLNSVAGLGPRLQTALRQVLGTPSQVLAASGAQLLSVEGIGAKLSAAITQAAGDQTCAAELQACRDRGMSIEILGSPDYPQPLADICDPPQVLYRWGNYLPQDELAVAIVGSRRATLYGRQIAEKLGASLARAGVSVVSGLARGIDACAHRGALGAGGRTLAVLATGLANIYPPEHVGLAAEVSRQGALFSEAPLHRGALKGMFPQRNRVISGLCRGVIIVEAGRQSGALHTARHALEQGREVFAVPGRIDSPESAGCHDLIRDGVTLLRTVDDVLEGLGPLPQAVTHTGEHTVLTPRELTLNDQEREVLELIPVTPVLLDDVLAQSSLEPPRVLATLTVLEMKRLVRRLPGGQFVRVSH